MRESGMFGSDVAGCIGAALLMLAGLGCVAPVEQQEAEQVSLRKVLLCQQGLSDRVTGWDKGLYDLCERVEEAGFELVRDGDHPAFGALDENGAYEALFDTLDTNGDGLVDRRDQRTAVHLVGFSWGGVNIADIARRLSADKRTAPGSGGVMAMVLLDAYQPFHGPLDIPPSVYLTWVYRQTETTSDDCSHDVSLGFGYRGLAPRQDPDALGFCVDVDLEDVDPGLGHCDVVESAADAAFHNLTTRRDYAPWADVARPCD